MQVKLKMFGYSEEWTELLICFPILMIPWDYKTPFLIYDTNPHLH